VIPFLPSRFAENRSAVLIVAATMGTEYTQRISW
jgi:hypothetical protein